MPDEKIDLPVIDVADAVEDTFEEFPNMADESGMTADVAAMGAQGEGDEAPPESAKPAKRGRGRPPKAKIYDSASPRPEIKGRSKSKVAACEDVVASQAPAIEPSNAGIEPAAQMCVLAVQASGMMLGGEEAAMRENEIILAKSGFVGYFQAKGVENVPAWVVLAGGLAPYYIRILTTTPARSTVPSLFRKGWFGIKEFWRKKRDARVNRRYDGQRQDDGRDQVSR